jgi:hypothetical protein
MFWSQDGSFTGQMAKREKLTKNKIMIEEIHIIFGILIPAVFALILSTKLQVPGRKAMEIGELYCRNAVNICINLVTILGASLLIKIILNEAFFGFLMGWKISSAYWDALWIFLGLWTFYTTQSSPKYAITPSSNSVLRVTNCLFTRKRELNHNQGEVENSVKYPGSMIALLNLFDRSQGEIQTESQETIEFAMETVTCKKGQGSIEKVFVNYIIDDSDAYAGNGKDEPDRKKKVASMTQSDISALIEKSAITGTTAEIISDPEKYFGSICSDFRRKNTKVEEFLGISIQSIGVFKFDESKPIQTVIEGKAINDAIATEAENLVKRARAKGDETLTFGQAYEHIMVATNPRGNVSKRVYSGIGGANVIINDDDDKKKPQPKKKPKGK